MSLGNGFVVFVDDILEKVVHLAHRVGECVGKVDFIVLSLEGVLERELVVLFATGWLLAVVGGGGVRGLREL